MNFLDATIKANKEIIELIQNSSHTFLSQNISLGFGGDISSKIDILAEKIFIKHLKKFGDIYSEECGFVKGEGKYNLVIDPLDGSNNFASNLPYFGTSVALKFEDKTVAAVILNLATGDIFYKDLKVFKKANIHTLNFNDITSNKSSKVGILERSYCSDSIYDKLKAKHIKFRSPGAFALSLAYGHDVDFVIYEGKMRAYDVEAGLYMCEDLYRFMENDILFISKDKEIFDRISKLLGKG